MEQLHVTLAKDFFVGLFKESRENAFAKLMEEILNQVLLAESDAVIQAGAYERNGERTDYRNGTRSRSLNLRIGKLNLRVPRHRNVPFKTMLFEEYQRNEQALVATMMEMVAQGVASRNVQKITEQLCDTSFSKSMVSDLCKRISVPVEAFRTRQLHQEYPFLFVDAIYFKQREHGHARSKAFMVALGINQEGYKEIVGFDLYETESESTWKEFLEDLKERGLRGVDIITSDAHAGLRMAIQETFPHVPWQRCQFHFKRNILDKMKKADRAGLSLQLRDLFEATSIEQARALRDTIIDEYGDRDSEAMAVLEEGFEDSMTVLSIPMRYRKTVRTSNMLERENRELRKRQNPIGVFNDKASILRLMGAVLMDDHEDWAKGNRSFQMEEYYQKRPRVKKELECLAEPLRPGKSAPLP
jgi:putative transposase